MTKALSIVLKAAGIYNIRMGHLDCVAACAVLCVDRYGYTQLYFYLAGIGYGGWSIWNRLLPGFL